MFSTALLGVGLLLRVSNTFDQLSNVERVFIMCLAKILVLVVFLGRNCCKTYARTCSKTPLGRHVNNIFFLDFFHFLELYSVHTNLVRHIF